MAACFRVQVPNYRTFVMKTIKPIFRLAFFFFAFLFSSLSFAQDTAAKAQAPNTSPEEGMADSSTATDKTLDHVGKALTSVFVNISQQDVSRLQVTSLVNIAGGDVHGLQLSGLANVVKSSLKGCQITGLSNVVAHDSRGTQLAGVSNYVGGAFTGFQAAGILNYAQGPQKGFQISGIANVSQGDSHGAQLASLFNQAKTVNYLQMSGGINIADTLKGAQIGLINWSKNQQGFQLGLINLSDTITGRSLGLITLVKKGGHYAFEAYTTPTFFANVSLQMGTRRLYTTFSGGYNDENGVEAFTTSLGFGSVSSGSKWLQVRQELSSGWVRAKYESVNTDMSLFKYDLLLQLSVLPKTRVFVGPSANYLISWTNNTEAIVDKISPYTHADGNFGQKPWEAWIGFRAGVQLGL
jgi:hypothetical protein